MAKECIFCGDGISVCLSCLSAARRYANAAVYGYDADVTLPAALRERVERLAAKVMDSHLFLPPSRIKEVISEIHLPPPPPDRHYERVFKGIFTFRSEELPPDAINPRRAEWIEEDVSWRDDERVFRYRVQGWEYEQEVWEWELVNRDEVKRWREDAHEWWKGLPLQHKVALLAVHCHPCPECSHPAPALCVVPSLFHLLGDFPIDATLCVYIRHEHAHQPVEHAMRLVDVEDIIVSAHAFRKL